MPLRQLTCKGVKWQWSEKEQHSFESLKAALSVKTTLAYYDPEKPTSIFVDGSPVGLGAVLTQEDTLTKEVTPIYYASCPLTSTQSRNPQIDREARGSGTKLQILFHCQNYHGMKDKEATDLYRNFAIKVRSYCGTSCLARTNSRPRP